jgi:splicing factor 3A subunit 1
VVTLQELPVSYLVSTLRERLVQTTGSALPVGRIRFTYNGQTLTNMNTIASYNLEDEDELAVVIQDRKKK